MRSKLVILAAALAAGAAVAFLPDRWRLAVITGVGVLVFGAYALRTRGALRALRDTGQRQADRENRELGALAKELAAQRANSEQQRTLLDRLQAQIAAANAVGKELAALHTAATNEILDTARGQRAEMTAGVDRVEKAIAKSDLRLSHTATQTELRRLHTESRAADLLDFRQVEALLNLYALFPVRSSVPPSRKWAASADLLAFLVSTVLTRRPKLIVELGGGLSTLWMAYALEKADNGGRIISLDHDEAFATKTRALLAEHGLGQYADIRHAPLNDIEIDGEKWPWYDLSALADVQGCDLLLVDGPPAATRDHARFPALPMLIDKLAASAAVVVDDCVRQDEKDIVERWRERFAGWQVDEYPHEKVTVTFTR